MILKCLQKEKEVCHSKDWLCLFGDSGVTFAISNNCNTNSNSRSNLGHYDEYELPFGI